MRWICADCGQLLDVGGLHVCSALLASAHTTKPSTAWDQQVLRLRAEVERLNQQVATLEAERDKLESKYRKLIYDTDEKEDAWITANDLLQKNQKMAVRIVDLEAKIGLLEQTLGKEMTK